jgi:hypothetical protein
MIECSVAVISLTAPHNTGNPPSEVDTAVGVRRGHARTEGEQLRARQPQVQLYSFPHPFFSSLRVHHPFPRPPAQVARRLQANPIFTRNLYPPSLVTPLPLVFPLCSGCHSPITQRLVQLHHDRVHRSRASRH